jgi:Bacterial Ig-like domain
MNAPTNTGRPSPSRRIGLLLVALIAALLAAFALASMATQKAAQADEEETVDVPASKGIPGKDTGIYIHQGERVVIEPTGTVDLSTPPTAPWSDVPPDGIANTAGDPVYSGIVLPSANVGALLGSIGQFSATNGGFLVGSEKSFTAQKSGELYLIVNDSDFSDNPALDNSFTAKVKVTLPDTLGPRVSSTVPATGATDLVGPFANAKANFSEDMRASTINGTTFNLFKQGSTNKVGATVSYQANNDRAILNPTNGLQRGATYKAVVTTSAMDNAGNRLDQNRSLSGLQQKTWTFKVSNNQGSY